MSSALKTIRQPKQVSVPLVKPDPTRKPHNWFMLACCALMVVGFGIVLISGPTNSSFSSRLLAASPLLICIGAHWLMHRMTGHSCHQKNSQED
ncbi:MAG: DUF2933 domain-containing protein [Rhizobiaceae bacterium]|nr:DUF2933 domain-containing protein [Rhizobiaceae bacterium]